MGVAYPLSKKLAWSLMGWKPSSRGVDLDMVRRKEKAIGMWFSRMDMVWGSLTWDSGCWPGLWWQKRFLPKLWARIWYQELGLNWENTRRVEKILPNVQSAGLDSVEWEISTRDVGLVFRELVWNLMGWKAFTRGTGHDMVSSFILNKKRLLGLFSIQFPPIY